MFDSLPYFPNIFYEFQILFTRVSEINIAVGFNYLLMQLIKLQFIKYLRKAMYLIG